MAKSAYVYSGTDWVPLASEVTNLSGYQTKALNQFPNRNLVINGAMQVAQRGTSTASITSDNYYTVDRWKFLPNSMGTWTMSQENDAPTGSGFRKSTKVLCTTADASPATGDYVFLDQYFEGQNVQHLKKGTASAEQLTLSFWVKANKTGTYIASIRDADNNRSCSKSYTISASATWEYKTITFPADTTGPLDNDNALSLYLRFWMGAGSSYTSGTLETTWATSTNANLAVGQVNLADATNNYWQVTGVQLEVGDTATPFEFKPYAQDLAECQRYLPAFIGTNGFAGWSSSTARTFITLKYPVTARTAPTGISIAALSNYQLFNSATTAGTPTAINFDFAGTETADLYIDTTAGSPTLTAGQGGMFKILTNGYLLFTGCEL